MVGASGGTASIDISSAGLTVAKGFSISCTVSNLQHLTGNNTGLVFSLGSSSANTLFGMGISKSANIWGNAEMTFQGSSREINTTSYSSLGSITEATPVLLTVVFCPDETNATKLSATAYLNGVLAGKGVSTSNDALNDVVIEQVTLGAWGVSTANSFVSETISGIQIYNTALTEEEVQLYAPEPTTATLSLLALAGLAARRRRK